MLTTLGALLVSILSLISCLKPKCSLSTCVMYEHKVIGKPVHLKSRTKHVVNCQGRTYIIIVTNVLLTSASSFVWILTYFHYTLYHIIYNLLNLRIIWLPTYYIQKVFKNHEKHCKIIAWNLTRHYLL